MPKEFTSASASPIDFSNVSDSGATFNTKRQPAGDYEATVINVYDAPSKKDGEPQWLFVIQVGSGSYPYYCKLVENQLWKLRNLLIAGGLNVPKKRIKVDPTKMMGRKIAVTLDDEEYEGKDKSVVTATFPLAELNPDASRDTEDEEDEDEEETPAPAPRKKAAPVVEDEEDEEEEEEAPAPKKKAAAVVADDDDELEELDIDI
jgi:hypothetical protein